MTDNKDKAPSVPELRSTHRRNLPRKAKLSVGLVSRSAPIALAYIKGMNKETINYVHERQGLGSHIMKELPQWLESVVMQFHCTDIYGLKTTKSATSVSSTGWNHTVVHWIRGYCSKDPSMRGKVRSILSSKVSFKKCIQEAKSNSTMQARKQ
jgi:hypothetical protein